MPVGRLEAGWQAQYIYTGHTITMGETTRRPMVTEVHNHPNATIEETPVLLRRAENSLYTKSREISLAQENGGHTNGHIDLTPHALSNSPIARLKRLAHRHRHDFHYLRRIQWDIIESYLRPGP